MKKVNNNTINLTENIEWNKVNYIWNKFFDEISQIDENNTFSSILWQVMYENIWSNSKLKNLKNAKQAKYSEHIKNTFWYYILLKYNFDKSKIENRADWDRLVSNIIEQISKLDMQGLELLLRDIFNVTRKAYSEVLNSYDKVKSINTLVKSSVHDTINLKPSNFHDINVNKNEINYLPQLLEYIIFPKKSIDGSDSIFLNNINIDSKKNSSNFWVFLDLFRLKSVFWDLDLIYKKFSSYIKSNKKHKKVRFYNYYNPEIDAYENSAYSEEEEVMSNLSTIFFQWFIEQKKDYLLSELNYEKKKIDQLSYNDILREYNEINELIWDIFDDSLIDHFDTKTGEIRKHLLSISMDFYNNRDFVDLYKVLDNIPNSNSSKEIKDNYIDIELLVNWIKFIYFSKLYSSVEQYVKISEVSFTREENWNIIKSENYSDLISILLKYIDSYITTKDIKVKDKSIFNTLILNGLLENILIYNSENSFITKANNIINTFDLKEKSNIGKEKKDIYIFPLKKYRYVWENKSLDYFLSGIDDKLFIWSTEIDVVRFDDIKDDDHCLEKINEISENSLEVSKKLFLDRFLKEKVIKINRLNYIIKQNTNTISLLVDDPKYWKILKDKVNYIIKSLLQNIPILTIKWQYTEFIDNIIWLYNISQKYWFNFDAQKFNYFLSKQNIKIILSYLKNRKIWNPEVYSIINKYLSKNINIYLDIEISIYFPTEFKENDFVNIKKSIDSNYDLLKVYISVLNKDDKEIFINKVRRIFYDNVCPYYKKKFEEYRDSETKLEWEKLNEFYGIFYSLKRTFKKIFELLWVNDVDLEILDFDEKIKEYGQIKTKVKYEYVPYERKESKVKSDDKLDDIYDKYHKYIDKLFLKYKINNHIKKMNKDLPIDEIEEFLELINSVDVFTKDIFRRDFNLYYLNLIYKIGLDIYKSEKIKVYLIDVFNDFISIKSGQKKYLFWFLSSIWFYNYVYCKEVNKLCELSKENIEIIEHILKFDETLYDKIKEEIVRFSKDTHSRELRLV